MVEISDVPDDGDKGGAPNKKPQEEPGEEARTATTTSLESLPVVLLEQIVARVPRSDHPAISAISKSFGRLIASTGLRDTRSQLAITEHVLYALLALPPLLPSWYILYRRKLRRVTTLPPMPYGSAVVTVGHEIYVIGGCNGVGMRYLTNVTLVDCRTHTCRSLPSMRVARYRAAAGVVNGGIYVMGGCENRTEDWVEWFDLERQVWHGTRKEQSDVSGEFVTYDVVKEKIYGLGLQYLHVYDPKEGLLKTWMDPNDFKGLWQASSCVVDDMLYTMAPVCWVGHPIIVFDPEDPVGSVWRPVRGVYGLPPCLYWYACESKMANVGGKLVVLVGNQSVLWSYYGMKYIWCVEIGLERREEDGEIWGRVESVEVVFQINMFTAPYIELCRTVIV